MPHGQDVVVGTQRPVTELGAEPEGQATGTQTGLPKESTPFWTVPAPQPAVVLTLDAAVEGLPAVQIRLPFTS